MHETRIFNFEDRSVGAVELNGEPWFVAKDICRALGLKNTSDAVKDLDLDEKGIEKIYTAGGNQKVIIVSESGLYHLIGRSSKPQAKKFARWLRKTVLPALNKNGFYVDKPMSQEEITLANCEALIEHKKELKAHEKGLKDHERRLKSMEKSFEDPMLRNSKEEDLPN